MPDPRPFDYSEFDGLLARTGPVAIVGQQLLKIAAISPNEVVFPPSYANPSEKKDDPPVYNIDQVDPCDPSKNVCVLDSIPSQANRMEPLFRSPAYSSLVPQYSVRLLEDAAPVSILDVGHRLADAVFRGTTLRGEIVAAFKSYAKGNAAPIAKLGPTSLVFGAWDSRGTGVKVPRLINSIVRAFNVSQLRRSAQYIAPIKYEQEGLLPSGLDGKPADHGLADVPSTHEIGGVQINGEIRRDISLNLSVLRALRDANEQKTQQLQRYILGLALVAITAVPESTLRQGCQLLPKGEPTWRTFGADGREINWTPASLKIGDFAAAAAADFGVKQPPNQPLPFDKALLKTSIEGDAKKKAEKRATDETPIDTLSRLVDALKVSRNGAKFNDGALKKLSEHLADIADGSMKMIAESIKSALGGDRPPEEKIKTVKGLIDNERHATPVGSSAMVPESQAAGEGETP